MDKYAKVLVINLIFCFLISFSGFSENIATTSNITKTSDVIISKNLTSEDKETTSDIIPNNAQKILREDLISLLNQRLYWSFWTWLNEGSYVSVDTHPSTYLDNSLLGINYSRNIFENNLVGYSPDQISNIIFERFKPDMINKLITDMEYYFTLEADGTLYLYSKDLSGVGKLFSNRWKYN